MEPDKRYLVFCYSDYYPGGGLSDKIGSYDTLDKAIKAAKEYGSDYQQIYDRIEGKEIEFE